MKMNWQVGLNICTTIVPVDKITPEQLRLEANIEQVQHQIYAHYDYTLKILGCTQKES